jgi:ABC-type multidrug transport system fused ATPase/permease subunit
MPNQYHHEIPWLARQMAPFWRLHLGGLSLSLISSFFVILDPLIIRFLIDDVLPSHRLSLLLTTVGALLLAYLGRAVFDVCGSLLTFRAVQKLIFTVRLNLLRRLQRFSAEYFDRNVLGDLTHRVDQDVTLVGEMSGQMLTFVVRTLLSTTTILIAMSVINVRLTVTIVPLVPLFLLLRRCFQKRLRNASDLTQYQAGRVSGFLQEHVAAITQVQLLCRELVQARKFSHLAGNLTRTLIKRQRTELLFATSSSSIIVVAVLTVLGLGSYQVLYGSLSIGGLVAFYSYSIQLFGPLYGVMDIYSKYQRIAASIRRLLEIDEANPAVRDPEQPLALPQEFTLALELRGVSFSYRVNEPVLVDVNLRLSAGEKVALVGPSGGGKSTIARLLVRQYDAEGGVILVNGMNVRDVKLKALRSTVSLVPQEPVLFDTTLRENLLYGNPQATEDELEEAISIAQLEGLFNRLPKGWHELVGNRGTKLSGGERQRVALARSILQRPRILVLDECTSALDSSTEMRLLDGIEECAKGKTTLIISHRLSTILWADRIVLVAEGRVAGEGSHRQLYQMNNLYRMLCDNQFEMENRKDSGYRRNTRKAAEQVPSVASYGV